MNPVRPPQQRNLHTANTVTTQPVVPPDGAPTLENQESPPMAGQPGQVFTPGVGWHNPNQGAQTGGQGWRQTNGGIRTDHEGGMSIDWNSPAWGNRPPGSGGIDPVDVNDPTPGWGNFNQFADATWEEYQRTLDPQFAAQEAAFRQRMVNQGISEGSQAYDNAWANFERGRNDAYGQGRRASLDAALGAQQQFWGQNYQESALANALAQARLAAQTSVTTANIGAGASRYGSDQSRIASMYGTDAGRMNFLDQLDFSREGRDFSQMMEMLGYGDQQTQYNNSLLGYDQDRLGDFDQFIPGVQPSQIDVAGPYYQQYQQQLAQQQRRDNRNAQEDAQEAQMWGTIAAAFLSDENSKTDHGDADGDKALEAVRSAPARSWTYHGDTDSHVGPMAQDFNMALHGEPRTTIAVQDAVGANWAATQELDRKVSKLAEALARRG